LSIWQEQKKTGRKFALSLRIPKVTASDLYAALLRCAGVLSIRQQRSDVEQVNETLDMTSPRFSVDSSEGNAA